MLSFSLRSPKMLCEWVDPIFVRYALLIVLLCAAVTILTTLHLIALCGSSELPRRHQSDASRPRKRWLSSLYVLTMFGCTCALIVLSDMLVGRVFTQTSTIRRILSTKFSVDRYDTQPFWDGLQRNYECCGLHNATDWWPRRLNGDDRTNLPDTCCPAVSQQSYQTRSTIMLLNGGFLEVTKEDAYMNVLLGNRAALQRSTCSVEEAYAIGCNEALAAYVRNAAKWLSLFAFGFACIAMLGGFVACAAGYGLNGGQAFGRSASRDRTPATTANANRTMIGLPSAPPSTMTNAAMSMRTYAESMA